MHLAYLIRGFMIKLKISTSAFGLNELALLGPTKTLRELFLGPFV